MPLSPHVITIGFPRGDMEQLQALLSPMEVRAFESGGEGVEALHPDTAGVVFDDRLPGAPELIRAVVERAPEVPLMLVVGLEGIGEVLRAGCEGIRLSWALRSDDVEELAHEVRKLVGKNGDGPAPGDRRAFPRAPLEEPTVLKPAGVELQDISPGGVLLLAPAGWSVGDRVELVLQLTAGVPVQQVAGDIIRVEPGPLGREAVVARFVNLSERFQRLIQKQVLEHMEFRGLRELPRRFREEGIGCAPIVDPARIEALLRQVDERELRCYISGGKGRPWRAPMSELDLSTRRFRVPAAPAGHQVREGDRLDFFLHVDFEGYLFEALVLEASPALCCAFPQVLYFSEKRADERCRIGPDSGLFVEVDALPPWGRQRWPLHDVSTRGLSFVVPGSRALILPGTPFRPLRVVLGDRTIFDEEGEVRHISVLPGEEAVTVGVALREPARDAPPPPRPAPRLELQAPTPVRPRRERSPVRVVKYLNSKNEEVAALYNTSHRGDERFASPVVIISPSWGRSKESFSTLALWLCERFGRLGQPVAVLRFDFTHSKGESYIPPENRVPGRECLDFTFSSALDDLGATIRFVHQTPLFTPTTVVLVGYSMSGPLVLRAAAQDPRVAQVVCAMGAPSLQETLRNCTGGIDYVAGYRAGHRFGQVNFLGYLVDVDRLCRDALDHGLAYLHDLKRDVAALPIPVGWLVGEHDAWVARRTVEDLLSAKHRGPAPDLVEVRAGHVPTMSDEAMAVAEETTRLVWRTIHGAELPRGAGPTPETLERVARAEWGRAPKAAMGDARVYWADYLLGEGDGVLGYDFLCHVDAYRELMRLQAELLEAGPEHAVLDAAGGTGNYLDLLLGSDLPLPGSVEVVDLVPQALERAREKTRERAGRAGLAVAFRAASLDASRLRPVERFVRGELHSPSCLRGRLPGLDDESLLRIVELHGPEMHTALRGGAIHPRLARILDPAEQAVIADFGRLARLVRGLTRPEDLRPGPAPQSPRTSHLRLDVLDPGDVAVDEKLDLQDEAYDRILASLMLSYLFNPEETLHELHRALKPGGRLVASTVKPDTDISTIFMDFVEGVNSGRIPPPEGLERERFIEELRTYTGSAAFLLRLAEEQTFHLFTEKDLRAMFEAVGFHTLEVRQSFGDPPQAFVCVAVKES